MEKVNLKPRNLEFLAEVSLRNFDAVMQLLPVPTERIVAVAGGNDCDRVVSLYVRRERRVGRKRRHKC